MSKQNGGPILSEFKVKPSNPLSLVIEGKIKGYVIKRGEIIPILLM